MMQQLAIHPKKKVLCTHNSARSQMAEGLPLAMRCDGYEAYSAGIFSSNVDPQSQNGHSPQLQRSGPGHRI